MCEWVNEWNNEWLIIIWYWYWILTNWILKQYPKVSPFKKSLFWIQISNRAPIPGAWFRLCSSFSLSLPCSLAVFASSDSPVVQVSVSLLPRVLLFLHSFPSFGSLRSASLPRYSLLSSSKGWGGLPCLSLIPKTLLVLLIDMFPWFRYQPKAPIYLERSYWTP